MNLDTSYLASLEEEAIQGFITLKETNAALKSMDDLIEF